MEVVRQEEFTLDQDETEIVTAILCILQNTMVGRALMEEPAVEEILLSKKISPVRAREFIKDFSVILSS